MRRTALAAVFGTALLAASVAFAARGAAGASGVLRLGQAVRRTQALPSLRFHLTAQIGRPGDPQPYVLQAQGAADRTAEHVHIKVDDVTAPNGTVLHGPSADEKVDGTFLYVRSTLTRTVAGPLWVRERLAALAAKAPELRTLRQVSPHAVLVAVARARGVRAGAERGVFHAWLPFSDPVVRAALGGVEGGTEYRQLHLTAWASPHGILRLVLLTGRTADGSSTFLLTLALDRFGQPVAVTPPPQGAFVDYALSQLSE